jgi:hypothetical protein
MEMQVQVQTCSTAGRLIGRDHSIYIILATHAKLVGKYQHSFLISAEKNASDRESCEDMYYNVLPKMLCSTLHWVVFWIELHKNELLEVKVTVDFWKLNFCLVFVLWPLKIIINLLLLRISPKILFHSS